MIPREELLTKYLHTECLRPQRVINPYTTEVLFTPCGRCAACIARKANLSTADV
jgi:7-cyano-7-deazaguanine synthase in queuosine biosynthesis